MNTAPDIFLSGVVLLRGDSMQYQELWEMAATACVEKVAERVKLHLMERIMADVYNFGDGKRKIYHGGSKTTTYQFYNSVENILTSQTEKLVEYTISSNPDNMDYDRKTFLHGSITDARENLLEILGENKTGTVFGERGWWRKRPAFWTPLTSELENSLIDKWFKEELNNVGLSCVE